MDSKAKLSGRILTSRLHQKAIKAVKKFSPRKSAMKTQEAEGKVGKFEVQEELHIQSLTKGNVQEDK